MIDWYFEKADPETRLWFGINGFRFNSKRNSPSRGKVIDYGWYFMLFIAGYVFCVFRERSRVI